MQNQIISRAKASVMIWLIIGLVLMALISVIAFTRVWLIVDSEGRIARISWGRVITAELTDIDSLPVFRVRIFLWKRDMSLLKVLSQPKRRDRNPRDSHKSGQTHRQLSPGRILKLIRSFDVKEFRMKIDTDDYTLNARLWPFIEFLRYRGLNVGVNFNGLNEVKLKLCNSPVRMLIAWYK